MSQFYADLANMGNLNGDERLRALERIIPQKAIEDVLKETGHAKRHCKTLPRWFAVWFVIALGLFCKDCYECVCAHLQRYKRGGGACKQTLNKARCSLGLVPLQLLAGKVVHLLCTVDTPGAFHRNLRLMALDGFILDVYDNEVNFRAFKKPKSDKGLGAFPQVRVMALCEIGSHVLYRWQVKPSTTGEAPMARDVLQHLQPGMLLMWDRNLFSYRLIKLAVCDRGAQLLVRLKKNLIFKPIEALKDGSYLAKVYASQKLRDLDQDGILVRIIEYKLEGKNRPHEGEEQRLLTTLLDPDLDSAEDLVVLYHERWEVEGTIDEVKTHQRERPVLRSRTPAGVLQEVEGLLLAHYMIRFLMAEAAEREGLAPRQMSFVGTLKILRNRLPEVPLAHTEESKKAEALLQGAACECEAQAQECDEAIAALKAAEEAAKVVTDAETATPGECDQAVAGVPAVTPEVAATRPITAAEAALKKARLACEKAARALHDVLAERVKQEALASQRWWDELLAEIGEQVLPDRRERYNPRVIKKKISKWPTKRPRHRKPPQPSQPFRKAIRIIPKGPPTDPST